MTQKEFLTKQATELQKLIDLYKPKSRAELCAIIAPTCWTFKIETKSTWGIKQGVKVTIWEGSTQYTFPKGKTLLPILD